MRNLTATAEELNEGSVDVDGYLDVTGSIRYIGRARRQEDKHYEAFLAQQKKQERGQGQ